MNEAVCGEEDRTTQRIGSVVEIGEFSAGFFDEKDACGGVPALEAKFPEAVEAACGDAGEIECGGAIAADPVGAQREIVVVMNVGARLAFVYGKAGAKKTGGKRGNFGDGDFLVVERGAFAASGSEKLFVDGIVNDTGDDLIAPGESNGDAEARVAVGKICGAVERIDVPAEFGFVIFAEPFFCCDGVGRKIF